MFSLITMAIWAQQENTHEHLTKLCAEKTYFDFGRSFGLCIVGWVLCFANIVIRVVFANHFHSAAASSSGHSDFDQSPFVAAAAAKSGAYNTL